MAKLAKTSQTRTKTTLPHVGRRHSARRGTSAAKAGSFQLPSISPYVSNRSPRPCSRLSQPPTSGPPIGTHSVRDGLQEIRRRQAIQKKLNARAQFDAAVHDVPDSTDMIKMLKDSVDMGSGVNNPVQNINMNRVKWRITRRLLHLHTRMINLGAEEKDKLGGSGIVRAGHETRPWDYLCLVNSSLLSDTSDALSYHRLKNVYCYKAMGMRLAFCTVLMMQKLQSEEKETGEGLKKTRKVKEKRTPAFNAAVVQKPLQHNLS
jgi:hypothetical protein